MDKLARGGVCTLEVSVRHTRKLNNLDSQVWHLCSSHRCGSRPGSFRKVGNNVYMMLRPIVQRMSF